MFHSAVHAWFSQRFSAPTPIQARAWPAIAEGQDCLIAAPTGSGKTLAAFLFCLDRLVRAAEGGALPNHTEVVYVSPLKALSHDVQRNLEQPLVEITAVAERLGTALPPIRTAVRTGDTSASDRREAVKRPPHVLVTTPESLFILLTSESGRRALAGVRTVILDEIHAVAGDKRGAHLALSVERLEDLVVESGGPRPQRIGLSATVRPIETAARLLVGSGRDLPRILDVGQRRDLDLAVEVPKDELGAVCTNEQWEEVYDRIAELARAHRSTLVFVNTRRLVERVALHLGSRLGETAVAAHHGSLSRARRHSAEKRLKAGELSVVVATASLELGIDIGAVDLTCLVGSPRSIGSALQRIGRSGHTLGGTPKGRLFPLTRDQLLECAAIVRAARRGTMDRFSLRSWPLDILAQQIVATCATKDCDEDALFDLVHRAAPYADLPRDEYDAVVTMLSEGIATRRGRAGALVHRDAVGKRLKGRRAARLSAITSGGAIPDNANYDVLLQPDGTKLGTLDEDFAIESMAGDVFLLGSSSWRIRRVEMGKVWVEDAKGAAPTVPFWMGEGPARTTELSGEVADLRQAIAERLTDKGPDRRQAIDAAAAWLMSECALDRRGALLACEYIEAARAVLGAVPTQATVIAERFFDEAGGMQLVIHAPFGGRINRAWGMALRKRFCRTFDFELQAAATDDGVLLSLGPQHSFPLETIFEMLHPDGIEEVLVQAALQAPMFGTRWRWDATRALALLRFQGGRKVPAPLLRMRSDDLLAAVFPAQTQCQDNHGVGAVIDPPDHPLVQETLRDCLCEVMDAQGLRDVLTRIARGEIRVIGRDTPEPSVLSHEILNANPYAFLDDAPLEERRARAVPLRRGLPADVAERIGGLDPAAIAAVVAEASPTPRDADELHDLLLDLVGLPEAEGVAAGWTSYFDELCQARRATRLVHTTASAALASGSEPVLVPSMAQARATDGTAGRFAEPAAFWVAAERKSLAAAIWPERHFDPEMTAPAGSPGARAVARDTALIELVRARLGLTGPVTALALAAMLGVAAADVDIALAHIEGDGLVLRGRFTPDVDPGQTEWCDRRLLARIHRRTVDGLRRAIEPATAADLVRFLLAWQGVRPGSQAHGRDGLLRVIGQLQGVEVAAGAWEREVFPARIADYDPGWLDELCLTGQVVWGRFAPRDSAAAAPTRAAPITLALRRDLPWLLAAKEGASEAEPGEADSGLSHPARDVLAYLQRAGASFFEEIVIGARRLRTEVEDALWELVAAGRITGDGFAGLRGLLIPPSKRNGSPRQRASRSRRGAPVIAAGRWALLRSPVLTPEAASAATNPAETAPIDEESSATLESLARQYLRRYGVMLRELLTREPRAPAWRDLLRVYRRLEMRGEIRGGRLVAGFVGEQFALPEALEALRAIRREAPRGEVIRLSACDPLNLIGILTPGPRVTATLGHSIAYRDGIPMEEQELQAWLASKRQPHHKQARARSAGVATSRA